MPAISKSSDFLAINSVIKSPVQMPQRFSTASPTSDPEMVLCQIFRCSTRLE
ncbi:unnamed protein product [Notodromas monacha]|uniref:Uncharacterized protein n=1 Tax=Notodromas monacha TaxID=399045 RepID=A0A7R9GHP1_9CRUS|nr:unnamed protein product [Notodromas monacha]CAG0923019.1 unnamed protein product [Notodromas monacha]